MASNREACGTVFFLFICNFITPCNWHVIQDPGNDIKQVLLMLELMTGHFFHIKFFRKWQGMNAQQNYAFEGKDYSNFPRGWAGMIIIDFFCRYNKTLFSDCIQKYKLCSNIKLILNYYQWHTVWRLDDHFLSWQIFLFATVAEVHIWRGCFIERNANLRIYSSFKI